MNQVQITTLKTKNSGGCYLTDYTYIVTDELGAKKSGGGSVAVSQPESVETEIQHNLVKKLGYRSFEVKFPAMSKMDGAVVKRPVLGVGR